MSEQDFESYLRLLSRFLRLSEGQRESIRRELRDHMQERLDELLASGLDRDTAIAAALDEFGDAAALAHDFDRIGRRRKWIMRSTVGALGLACFVLIVSSLLPPRSGSSPAPSVGIAAEPGRPTTRPAHATPSVPVAVSSLVRDQRAEEAARRKLEAVIPAVEFDARPLKETLQYLETEGRITLSVNWRALEASNVTPDSEVTAKLPNASLATALRIVLENVSDPGAGLVDYVLLDGALRISTQEDLGRYTQIRVYDCRDLIQRPLTADQRRFLESSIRQQTTPSAPGMAPGGMMGGRPGEGGGGFGGSGGFGGGGAPHEEEESLSPVEQTLVRVMDTLRKRDAQDLVELIKSTVEPATWYPSEDGVGAISEFDGLLVVRHNARALERLSELLSMLREAKAARPRAAAESERTASLPGR